MKRNVKTTNANAQQHDQRRDPAIQMQMNQAQRLNLEADIELQRGHHAAAERLSFRAAQLQGWL